MKTRNNIEAIGYKIELQNKKSGDFISLTDIAKYKTKENPGYVIQNWMRNRNTVRFLGLWESLHNTQFNYLEFEAIEKESGLNSFVLTPKRWIEMTSAIGITTKQGRYASTFAHKDIGLSQSERVLHLNKMAIEQLTILSKYDNKLLKDFNSD